MDAEWWRVLALRFISPLPQACWCSWGRTVDSCLDCVFKNYLYRLLGGLAHFPLCVVPRKGKENAKTGVEVSWFAMKG